MTKNIEIIWIGLSPDQSDSLPDATIRCFQSTNIALDFVKKHPENVFIFVIETYFLEQIDFESWKFLDNYKCIGLLQSNRPPQFVDEQIYAHCELIERPRLKSFLPRIFRESLRLQTIYDNASRERALSDQQLQLLMNITHELRTPLNTILGYAELIREEARDQELTEIEQDSVSIVRGATHLNSIIDCMVELSYIQSGQSLIRSEPSTIGELAKRIDNRCRSIFTNSSNSYELSIELPTTQFKTDLTKLDLAVEQLLDNANKFTSDGTITVNIGSGKPGIIDIAIKDNGVGMEREQMEKILIPFNQADRGFRKKHAGLGLGLTLTYHVVQALEGQLSVESSPNSGTTFTLVIPANRSTATSQAS